MNRIVIVLLSCMLFIASGLLAQNDPAWDNTARSRWPSGFEIIDVPSTADGKMQKAYMYKTKSDSPKPLIVSLHTWSGDYRQADPIIKEIVARDWNYIHPDFRGVNNKPEAMISPLVLSDIEDAVRFAVANMNVDPADVHIVGVSGGGLATLAAYMNVEYPVKSFSAWAPISDIGDWYWESIGRKQKYADDILNSLSPEKTFDKDEATRRSPLKHDFPKERRKDAKLFIYEGIHDGYTGSVPITHSINMYNRLVGELKYGTAELGSIMPLSASDPVLVSEKEIIELVTKRIQPDYDEKEMLFDRNIYLFREYGNIQLTIFEGGHEQIPQALGFIPYNAVTGFKYNILTIGDSNGQNRGGWVDQLKKMVPESDIINISRSGRTIGFDNNGQESLNALRNINSYMDQAQERLGNKKLDYIIVCLGTNDTKSEFSERQDEVVSNFSKLLDGIKAHKLYKRSKPKLIFVTPPPMGTSSDMEDKYKGGNDRLAKLMPQFEKVAMDKGFVFVDVFNPMQGVFDYYAADGVHMAAPGQEIIALRIIEAIRSSAK